MGQTNKGKPNRPKIIYATKAWGKDIKDVFSYHPKPDLVVANNLGFRLIDIGETDEPYYQPELQAVYQAEDMGAEYILWYASDVKPPEGDWVTPALKLLKKYAVVSPFWEMNATDFARTAQREVHRGTGFKETDFGFEDYVFSDQAYLAKIKTMLEIDYETDHPVKNLYPPHGGNSFERRVAQWLAATGKKRAVLTSFQYRHTPRDEK